MYEESMDMDRIHKELADVMQIDIDAIEAYNEAIEKVEAQGLRSQLSSFRDDHQRHVSDIRQAFAMMNARIPEQDKDFKGSLIEGMTSLRSSMGDEQALKAMRQNEQITNRTYEKAMDVAWPPEMRGIIERGLADERKHLQWIESQLSVGVGAREERY